MKHARFLSLISAKRRMKSPLASQRSVMRLVISFYFFLLSLVPGHRGDEYLFLNSNKTGINSIAEEQNLFQLSGVCGSEVGSRITTCDLEFRECVSRNNSCNSNTITTLQDLGRTNCYCDSRCEEYHDCCIDRVPSAIFATSDGWSCREVRGENVSRISIYVYQKCPDMWEDVFIRDMCEVESTAREKMRLSFDHLQDIPVLGEYSGRFYRNVFCAVCNNDTLLVKWSSYLYCNGNSENPFNELQDKVDLSSAVYSPRTMDFRKARVGDRLRNCFIIVRNFNIKRILRTHGARLCKPVIDTCLDNTNISTQANCKAYTSYVYKHLSGSRREVYKNFHCALCNGIPIDNISCTDSYKGPLYSGTPWSRERESSLTMLFDFNFVGSWESFGGRGSCLMSKRKIWDPILERCKDFTCGKLYKREGFRCVPLNETDEKRGLKDTCLKDVLNKDEFSILANGSVYINSTHRVLWETEFEVHKMKNNDIIQIAVCFEENLHLLPYSKTQTWLSYITLGISITCLVLHIIVYALIEKLRNCPGKILMSLSSSLLCGHIFLLIGPHFVSVFWLCYFSAVATHFGYLSAFAWMTIMAFDIHGTFSVTQTHNTRKSKTFPRYSLCAWISSLIIVAVSILVDIFVPNNSDYRAKYGHPICWFNSGKGLFIFFVAPATALLIANIVLFVLTAFHIRKVSRQTKMVNNFSNKMRFFLNLKLVVVLGLAWILGLMAAVTRMDAFWYPFIVLNGLQGALIFIAFTIKRSILRQLAVRLKIRSDKYRIGKMKGIKAAMYSSLSNLTSLQTTISSQIPSSTNSKEVLKSFKPINPDNVS